MPTGAQINLMQKALSYAGLSKPDGFNSYGLGNKLYGSGRMMPNTGATSAAGKQGYAERDRAIAAQKQALLERMQATNSGSYASAAFMRGR